MCHCPGGDGPELVLKFDLVFPPSNISRSTHDTHPPGDHSP